MNRGAKKLLIVLAVMCAGLFALWFFVFPSSSLHYKLSVDVDENGVTHHSEGVIEVLFQSEGPFLMAHTHQWSGDAIGEAFPVDIGERGTFFVLLIEDSTRLRLKDGKYKGPSVEAGQPAIWSYFKFDVSSLPNGFASKSKIDAFARSKQTVEIAPSQLPMLVRFSDLNDPKSGELVDPDNLEPTFGSGMRISKVTAAITDEPVTTGLEKKLNWVTKPSLMASLPSWDLQNRIILRGLFSGTASEHFK